jgi:hypothetical protein
MYVIFGQSVLNVAVGLVLSALGGAILSAAAARLSRRSEVRARYGVVKRR